MPKQSVGCLIVCLLMHDWPAGVGPRCAEAGSSGRVCVDDEGECCRETKEGISVEGGERSADALGGALEDRDGCDESGAGLRSVGRAEPGDWDGAWLTRLSERLKHSSRAGGFCAHCGLYLLSDSESHPNQHIHMHQHISTSPCRFAGLTSLPASHAI